MIRSRAILLSESGDETSLDMERVKRAARMAQLHEFIENKSEHGYDTMVGENGMNSPAVKDNVWDWRGRFTQIVRFWFSMKRQVPLIM